MQLQYAKEFGQDRLAISSAKGCARQGHPIRTALLRNVLAGAEMFDFASVEQRPVPALMPQEGQVAQCVEARRPRSLHDINADAELKRLESQLYKSFACVNH